MFITECHLCTEFAGVLQPMKITSNSNPSHSIIGTLNNKWRNLWWINLSMKIPHEKCVKIPSIHGRFALKIHHSGGDQIPSIRIWEPLGNCCHVAHPTMATISLAPPRSTWRPRGGSNPWVGSPENGGPLEVWRFLLENPPFFRGFYVSFQGCTTNMRMFGKSMIAWTENTNELMSI